MTTVASIISRIKRDLRRSYKEPINTLNATLTTSATSIVCTRSLNTATADSVCEVEDELVYVTAANTSTLTLTVLRGFDGTTAIQHASGAILRANPRFTSVDIRDAIAEEIRSWQPRLFRVGTFTQTITTNSGTRAWDFTDSANYLGRVISVKLQRTNTAYWNWPFPDLRPLDCQGDILSGQDTTNFASGWAFVLREGDVVRGLLPPGTVTVSYARTFDLSAVTDSTDLESTIGIPASSLGLLRLGVMWRLVAAQEVQRSDTSLQDEPRRSEELKPGDTFRTAAGLKALRDEMLTEEADKLLALYAQGTW